MTIAGARRLCLAGAIASAALLVVILAVESVLPIAAAAAVRDGSGLALVCVGSWTLYALARGLGAPGRPAGAAYAATLTVLIGAGAAAFVLTLVLDVVLAPGILPIAVPAAICICLVVPGVALAFAARSAGGPPRPTP